MNFEKVYTIRDYYDGIRTGTAGLSGAPHYFKSLCYETTGDPAHFRLYPVSAAFMERELRHWAMYRAWERKFQSGIVTLETHPGHGGIDREYDELGRWLNDEIKSLVPIPALHKATFRTVGGHELPDGSLLETEVAWVAAG